MQYMVMPYVNKSSFESPNGTGVAKNVGRLQQALLQDEPAM